MTSKKAQAFISRKIKKNIEEGYPREQAIAIAYSQARAKGYKLPQRSKFDTMRRERRLGVVS